tara:strand:- start:261 stop:392 length:132 start_codon:yes stop_codon:yes gene_type:complete
MIKIIYLTLILCCLLSACGKKGNPVYKESKEKIGIVNTFINKT